MSISTIKFSEFTSGGDLPNGSTTVGLGGGSNTQWNNPWTFLAPGTTAERPPITPAIYYRLRFNTETLQYEYYDITIPGWVIIEDSASVLPLLASHLPGEGASLIGLQDQTGVTSKTVQDLANATIIAQTDNGTLTNGQFLGHLSSGILFSTTTTGVLSVLSGSTTINAVINDNTFATATANNIPTALSVKNYVLSTPGSAGGSNTQIQYNHLGILAGDTGFTTDGNGNLVITNSETIGNLLISGNSIQDTSGSNIFFIGSTEFIDSDADFVQIASDDATYSLTVASFVANSSTPSIQLFKSRGTTVGSHGSVHIDDILGAYNWTADDGTQILDAGEIDLVVNGAVSTGIIPTQMLIYVNDITGTLINALTINAGGTVVPGLSEANNFIPGYTTTATAAGTTVLTLSSTELQYFTGSTTQTVTLPVTNTLILGFSFTIVNNSTGVITVNSSGGNLVTAMQPATQATFTCILTSGTTAASWNSSYSYENIGTPVTLADGGTSASLTASNGGIFYSTASAGAILSGTATATQMLQSGSNTAPVWSTTTWPATSTINQILYSSAANTISGLATANNGILVTSSGGVPSIGNTVGAGLTMPSITFNTTSGVIGTTTNNNAAAGSVGELVVTTVTAASPVSINNNTATDIGSVSLTAGDWDLYGYVAFTGGSTTTLSWAGAWISLTSATLPAGHLYNSSVYGGTVVFNNYPQVGLNCPVLRVSLASTTTVYFSTVIVFGVTSTISGYGTLQARRRR